MKKAKTLPSKLLFTIFGILLSIAILELALRISVLTFSLIQETNNKISLNQNKTHRILCFGESMTANQYPKVLQNILNEKAAGEIFEVIDKGKVLSSSTYIASALRACLDRYKPDMVIVMTGINDISEFAPYGNIPLEETTALKTYKLVKILWGLLTTQRRLYSDSDGRETAIKKSIERTNTFLNPEQFKKQEKIFKEAIEKNPGDSKSLAMLGLLYLRMYPENKFPLATEMFKKAGDIGVDGILGNITYSRLGQFYLDSQQDFAMAEKMFKKAIQIRGKTVWTAGPYFRLGSMYMKQGKFAQAEAILKEGISRDPLNDRLYTKLVACYQQQGEPKMAQWYHCRAERLSDNYYKISLFNNYRSIAQLTAAKGVKLICMNYPMKSIEPLKKMMQSQKNVYFIDNEEVFKNAVANASYEAYFIDNFGGEFGHCTARGNILMAENIANVILNQVLPNQDKPFLPAERIKQATGRQDTNS
ncbi:MAG: hypothetical protein WDL87_07765 [Candidatus Omnitrophota bacterium]|jgi:Tfp pilus assembly protein PilF